MYEKWKESLTNIQNGHDVTCCSIWKAINIILWVILLFFFNTDQYNDFNLLAFFAICMENSYRISLFLLELNQAFLGYKWG